MRHPFRVFANQNFGTQYDYTAFSGEWVNPKSTGYASVLPEVNIATGNVTLKSTTVKTQEQIGNWEFGFVYNAQNSTPWSMNVPGIISSNATQLIFQERDGSQVTYTFDATQNAFVAPSGAQSKSLITQDPIDKTYVQLDPAAGTRTFYNATKQITAVYDARGCGMQYGYVNGVLSTITSAAGVYTISTNNLVTSLTFVATGQSASQTLGTWTFDSNNRLQTATIPSANNYAINYAYNGTTNQLTSVTQTDGTSLALTYTTDNPAKVQTVQQGSNGVYTLAYTENNTTIADALGFVTTATLNANNTISTWTESVGDMPSNVTALTTTCTYTNDDLTNIAKPDGAQTGFTFNAQGLVTQKTKPSGQVTQYDYDTTTFARIIKRELQSGSGDTAVYATTRYVYNNNARQIPGTTLPCRDLCFTVSPQGCVNEMRYDNSGIPQSKRTYLQNAYPVAALTPTTPIKCADAKSWAAKQSLNAISLSTMRENLRGQRTSLRKFANINTNGSGNYDDFASHDQYSNHTIWGAAQTHTEKMSVQNGVDVNAITQDAFDGLHRLTSHQNALSNTKTIQYNDAEKNAVTTEYNGRTETRNWDTAGQISSIATAIAGSTTTRIISNQFDTNGRLTAVTGIDNKTTYHLFDSLNCPRFDITPTGRVTEYFYDDVNHYSGSTHYDAPVPISTLTTLPTFAWIAANLTKDATKDVTTYTVYDLSKRPQFIVAGNGSVTGYNYDLQNRKYLTTTYAAAISAAEITAIQNGTFSRTPSPSDCVSTTFYDNDNNIIGTQNGDNYLTQYQRNVAGIENCRTQYATPAESQNLTGTLPTNITTNAKKDFSQYLYTDARAQNILTVDGVTNANYVVQNSFYPNGKPQTETKFANQSAIVPSANSDPTKLIPTSDPEDQVTTNTYDLLNRLIQQNLPKQRLKSWQFDEMGNLTLECMGDDPATCANVQTHGHEKQFDAWGQLTAEATPLIYAKILSIQNDANLTPTQQQAAIAVVWTTQAMQYLYNNAGLHIAKIDVVPDDPTIAQSPITFFYYDADKRLVLTVGPDGQTTQITPDSIFNKAAEQTRYANAIDTSTLTGGFINSAVTALIIPDAAHDQTEKNKYDGVGNECEHTDAEGYVTKNHTDMFGNNDQTELPVNNTTPSLQINRQFNFRGSCTQEVKTAGTDSITTSKTFNNLHGACTSSTDGNGKTATFTHEPRGVLLTSADANGNATASMHDAFEREILRTLPMGQSIAQRYVQASRQIKTKELDTSGNVLAETSVIADAFGNGITLQDALGNTTQLLYNAANQWETKIDSNDNQYTRSHDLRGLLIQNNFRQSNPALFSSTSAFDYSLGRKLRHEWHDTTGLNLETEHEWNALGQEHKTTTPNGNIRKTVFDLRSLATEHQKILDDTTSVVTAQNYNGLQTANTLSTSTTNLTHTYQEQLISDGFGRESQRVVDPTGLALTHTKQLDNANRLIATVDPKGQTSYLVRDAVGNIRFEINAKGGVIEHQYNAANKPIFTAQYVNAVAIASLTVGMSITTVQALLNASDYDHHTYYFYDDLLNERFRVNRAGTVIESRYDLNREKISSIQYYTSITTDPTTLTTATLITQCAAIRNTTLDKASFRVLDSAGQEVFIINADGSVIQKFYNSMPHKVNCEIKYATTIANPESTAALSIAEITALLTTSSQDRQTYWMVDGLNRLQFHVTSSGAVTRYDYDGNTNNRIKITEFKAAVTLPPASYSALQTILNNLTPNAAVDNIEVRTYDAAEREITRTNGAGNLESFGYDGANRRSSHTTLSGNKWTYDYDGASRLRHEYSPATTVYAASIDSTNVTGITITPSTSTVVTKEVNYDANSNATCITSGVGLSDVHIVEFAYNELNLKNQNTWNNIPIDDPTQNTSLTVRPEKTNSVNKTVLHSAHGKILVETNEAGNSVFYAYDAQGYLKYKIDEAGFVSEFQRNSFGECEHLIVYATQLTINLSQYAATGLTPDIITTNLTKNPTSDRSFNSTFDQNGRVIKLTRDPVVCYIPDPNQNAPTIATQTPTKANTYNTFGEEISRSQVIDETNNILKTTLIWRDNHGNEIATVDANGKTIIKTFDTWNRKIEEYTYANSLSPTQLATLSTSTAFFTLQTLLATIADTTRDHDILTQHDVMGNVTGIVHVGILTQQIVSGQQAFENNPAGAQNIGVTFTYTRDNKVKTKTYPNGQVESFYYDERRYLIAKAFVPRTQTIGATSTLIQPIIYYHVSSHGDRVETYQPASGCVVVTDPTSEVVPLPVGTSAQDLYHRFMKDPRGNLLVKQDAENNLKQMTHTLTGKVARDYHPTTNATATTVTAGTFVTNLDENQNSYDVRDELESKSIYRDGNLQSAVAYQRNASKEITAEGPGDGTYPSQHQIDQAGRTWATFQTSNATAQPIGPVGELTGFNAAGDKTVTIQSHTKDLSTTSYAQLSTLMGNREDVTNYFFTETVRDAESKPTAFVEPGYSDNNTTVRPVNQIGFNNFGKKSFITTPSGNTTKYTHTKLNKLETQTDPVISVKDTSGNPTNVAAVTTLGYDKSNSKIGVRDANLNTELFLRDEARQELSRIAGDGTPYYTKTPNVFGQDFQVMSPSGNIWKKTFTSKGEVITVTQPSGDTWTYNRNENGFVNLITPPENSVMGASAYSQDVYHKMSGHFLPMGEQHLYENDRHGLLTHTAINVDGSTAYVMSLVRDFWGNVTNKTDGSGSTYQYSFYPSGVLDQELCTMIQGHGSMLIFNSTAGTYSQTPTPTQRQNKQYTWLTPLRLQTITDANTVNPQTLTKVFDIDRNTTSITETNGAGNILRQTVLTYDARRFTKTQTDINFSLTNAYDAVGNRRNINATYTAASGAVATHNAWWTYDPADRVLINDGQLINGVIQAVPYTSPWGYTQLSQSGANTSINQSNIFSYVNGLRATQSLYIPGSMGSLADENPLSATFGYDVNDRVASVTPAQYGSSGSRRRQESILSNRNFFGTAASILPIPSGVNYCDLYKRPMAVISWSRDQIPNETEANTTAVAINGNQFIDGVIMLAWNMELTKAIWGTPYAPPGTDLTAQNIATVIINVSGQIYQGAVPIPANSGSSIYSYLENITYTTDGLFLSSFINLNNSTQYILRQITYDQNGGVPNYIYFNLDSSAGNTTYSTPDAPFNVDGLPNASSTAWSSVTDNLTYTFRLFDTSVIKSVTGTRTDSAGTSAAVSCPRYYDPNNALNSVTGVSNPFNPNDTNQYSLYFNNSLLNGRILSEYRVLSGALVSPTEYFQDARGNIVAEYGEISNSQNQTAMALSLPSDPVTALNVSNLQSASATVKVGDSWTSISYELFRDAAYASILKAYSGVQLASGQRIDGKQTIDAYNKARDFSAFEKLIQVVYNAMYPALKTPQPPPPKPHHESFWDELIGIIVAVVIIIYAPELIGEALNLILPTVMAALGATIETGLVYAVAGALADAATQGIAVTFDDQHGFSIKEMLENAITTGATMGLAKAWGVAGELSKGRYATVFVETATIGLTVQLYEMSIGLRSKLDLKLIIEQAAAEVLSAKIDAELPNASKDIKAVVNDIEGTAVSTAFGAPINMDDLANLAGNYLGDEVADGADYLGNKIKSDLSTNMGASTNPTNFPDQIQPAQPGLQNISPDSAANDPSFDLYNAYENQLSDSVNAIAESNYIAALSSVQTDVENQRAERLQQRQTQKVVRPNWENDLSRELYDHQNSWWARGIMGLSAGINSNAAHFVFHAADTFTRDAMGDVAGSYGTDYFDALQNGTSTWSDAFDFVGADVGMQTLGEIGAGVLGYATEVFPSIGRNVASMFGSGEINALSPMRLRVMKNLADDAEGNAETGFEMFGKRGTAISTYSNAGFNAQQTLDHMQGIDFSDDVEMITLPRGTEVEQYMFPQQAQPGNYFTPTGTMGDKLGIYTSGRTPITFFATQDISVMRSTTADMVDRYSMMQYDWEIETRGGATQYFSPDTTSWVRKYE